MTTTNQRATEEVVGYRRGGEQITVEQMRDMAGPNVMEAVMIGGWEPVFAALPPAPEKE